MNIVSKRKKEKTDQIEWMNDGSEKLYTTYLSISIYVKWFSQ